MKQRIKSNRVGIIGLDTSHVDAFVDLFNNADPDSDVAGCPIVAAYPYGSDDIPSSVERVPGYVAQLQSQGIAIVETIEALVDQVDSILLLSNDGRPHLRQVLPCFATGKRVFIDKPLAGSLVDVLTILRAAEHFGVPTFSASAMRFAQSTQAANQGDYGRVVGADTYSHCEIEPGHPDLFWYGIHAVEMLFAAMGCGCEKVWRSSGDDADVVMGQWQDGRIGTFRGTRSSPHDYGGTVFTATCTKTIGPFDGYRGLVSRVAEFFHTGKVPVSCNEMIEVYAFMEAADESKRRGGVPVALAEVIATAAACEPEGFDVKPPMGSVLDRIQTKVVGRPEHGFGLQESCKDDQGGGSES